jgi:hypothetical protein
MRAGEELPIAMTFANRLLPGAYYASFSVSERVGDCTAPGSVYPDAIRFELVRRAVNQGLVDLEMRIEVEDRALAAVSGEAGNGRTHS